MLLIKNAEVYAPQYLGKRDVLICGGKIEYIAEEIAVPQIPCAVIDAAGKCLVPGLIDGHVHITGGGGEGGFHTRTPEIQLSELIRGGITTVVGVLGTDGSTRSVENLYAKTMALNEEGVTAYMMTGAYCCPGPTITGDLGKDILFCEKILGAKLAVSDHRSSNITSAEMTELASKTRVAGMISGKPGMIILHMGSGKQGLKSVFDALESSDLPVGIFRPTHIGRSERLRKEILKLLEMGGYADYTCGARKVGKPSEYICEVMAQGIPTEHITVSTDGHGSWSRYDKEGKLLEMGVASAESLLKELRYMIAEKKVPMEKALTFFTSNPADALGLNGKKGIIAEQADADLLLMGDGFALDTVIAKGEVMMRGGEILRRGTYE